MHTNHGCFAVTQAEHGQEKHLVVLNTKWQVVDKIPISIGPRYHRIDEENAEIPPTIRSGDVMRWKIEAGNEDSIKEQKRELEEKGDGMLILGIRALQFSGLHDFYVSMKTNQC